MDQLTTLITDLCTALIGLAKLGLDALAQLLQGVAGALGQLGTGAAVGGAITIGSLAAAQGVQQQPPGQLLGAPNAPITTAAQPATAPVPPVQGALPGAAPAPGPVI